MPKDIAKRETKLTSEMFLRMYKMMFRIRSFEKKAIELSNKEIFPGKLHSSLGQEAVAVGACFSLKKKDFILSTHRPVGHLLAKGADMGRIFAEFMGKAAGYSGGKGGMMHLVDLENGILPTQGIVGSNIPIAAGAALANKLQGKESVILCFFGDGASNTGSFHEGINLAALWKASVVYICENNQYAVSTKVSNSVPVENISQRAVSYGIPCKTVDGNDVIAVYQEVSKAVKWARGKKGPSLIEAKSYRLQGHYEGDHLKYRSQDEFERALEREPIRNFKKWLREQNICDDNQLEFIESDVNREVESAVEYGMDSPAAEVESVTENVY